MTFQEYLIAIVFILLTLFWLGIVSVVTIGCAHNFSEGRHKVAVTCLVLTIILIVVGIFGFKYMSDLPEMEFLKGDECAECGNLLNDTDKFCDQCGAEVPVDAQSECSECHAKYEKGDRFCAKCGASLSKGG